MSEATIPYPEPVLGGFVTCRPKPLKFKDGHTLGLYLMSDIHMGAAQTDYKLVEREVAEAIANNDRILINGDLFDMILPKDHKRFSMSALHPRLHNVGGKIMNEVVDWAVEIFEPAAHLIDMVGLGNHESAVEKYHSYDPLSAFIKQLQDKLPDKSDHVIHYGGFCGFVDYRFRDDSRHANRFVIYYHHGSGANAPVTKGLIDFNRKDTFVDADLIWLGHKHNRLHVAVQKLSCAQTGDDPKVKDVRHVMTGAYYNTYVGQSQASIRQHGRRSNYAADDGMAPQGKGGARVTLTFNTNEVPGYEVHVTQ
jgi:hypothetical protein